MQDEATQATEPESLMALTLGCRRFVLIGDQCQLGPVVKSAALRARGLGTSLFERLLAAGDIPITFLRVQHRMHPAIATFPATASGATAGHARNEHAAGQEKQGFCKRFSEKATDVEAR